MLKHKDKKKLKASLIRMDSKPYAKKLYAKFVRFSRRIN